MENYQNDITCQNIPSLLSSFVDVFVDFSVSGGLFLSPPPPPPPPPPSSPTASNTVANLDSDSLRTSPKLETVFPASSRLIAIGDLHGDLSKTKQALRLGNLIDDNDRWSGGSATVVQVGDILDRGGDELKILYLFEKLKREAARENGRVITMNGNHEIMNIECDFRFASREGLKEFEDWALWHCVGNDMKRLCEGFNGSIQDPFDGLPTEFKELKPEIWNGVRARIAALRPNGPISKRFLSTNQTIAVVGESIFVHGGLLPEHVEYGLERVNEDVSNWILGVKKEVVNKLIKGKDSIVWTRKFSDRSAKNCDCSSLEHVLNTVPGVKRMIMGHTIQKKGINGVCKNRAIRIDVGMSKGCGNGLPEVLEIIDNSEVRILARNPLYKEKSEDFLNAPKKGTHANGFLVPEQEQKQKQIEVNA